MLATDVHLYRVHKSMLEMYSEALSDMFDTPGGDANEETWEGVPIVKMEGDSDEEVTVLLEALYVRKCVTNIYMRLLISSIYFSKQPAFETRCSN